MKTCIYKFFSVFMGFCLLMPTAGLADDTCVFGNTESESVRPNIILLFDSGAEMSEVATHSAYDNTKDYTPDFDALKIVSVDPAVGDETGGETVTLTGLNFKSGATVKFGGNSATGVTVTATQITCTTPAGTGTVDITVTNTDGESVTKAGAFTYEAAGVPTITKIEQATGPEAGLQDVTITGTNFTTVASVKFGANLATGVSLVSETQITCKTPAGTGTVDVVVTFTDGQSVTLSGGFEYVAPTPAPSITSVSGSPGSAGDTVTITGSNFVAGATVKFGTESATGVSVVSATQITCTVPSGSGTVDVTVTNPDAQSATKSGGFEYKPAVYTKFTFNLSKLSEKKDKEFKVGDTVTGKTSDATAKITKIIGSPITSFEVDTVSGTFKNGETISNSGGSTATLDSFAGIGSANSFGGFGGGGDSSDGSYVQDTADSSADAGAVSPNTSGSQDMPEGVGAVGSVSLLDKVNASGFTNELGYGISKGAKYALVEVSSDLTLPTSGGIEPDSYSVDNKNPSYGYFTINGKTLRLPIIAGATAVKEVEDKVGEFRYSANYLNWLFFSGEYTGDGTDLPDKSRWYYAKLAIFTVSKLTRNRVQYSIYMSAGEKGATQAQPWKLVVDDVETNTLNSSFMNNINNMVTTEYSPLVEMLASAGGYFTKDQMGGTEQACAENFIILVSPGRSSHDQKIEAPPSFPENFADSDKDGLDVLQTSGVDSGSITVDSTTYNIPINELGSTYADDVAHYLYTNSFDDSRFRNIMTYTVGFAENPSKEGSKRFLINVSNNGNGLTNLTDTSHPDYGKYHFEAKSPDGLAKALWQAISAILSRTNTFTAPVVPVTRTTSGNTIYMAFFKPSEANFWDGNLVKFCLSDDIQILNKDCSTAATWPNGAIKDSADPFWEIKNWAIEGKSNFMSNDPNYSDASKRRKIYTYTGTITGGSPVTLISDSNAFTADNDAVKTAVGSIDTGTKTYTADQVINYIRGADVLDEDKDGNVIENRGVITGDILHSEPMVVRYTSSSGLEADDNIMVYYTANDGMLHAVNDSDGKEAWAFVPPGQLSRLKLMFGDQGHQYYVDATPQVYISESAKFNRYVDPGESAYLVFGERKGGTAYYALDISDRTSPKLLWKVDQSVISELGESWSEPAFGKVKNGGSVIPVCFIGGGYSADNSKGKAVIALNLANGSVVRKFTSSDNSAMNYSFPSAPFVADVDGDGLTDKVYIGDLGGQMWRFASFADDDGNELNFPYMNSDISTWSATVVYTAPTGSKFFYPPTLTLDKNYDILFMATGDREDACNATTYDQIVAVKDTHEGGSPYPLSASSTSMTNVTTQPGTSINLNLDTTYGWYINLPQGEKALAEGIVFFGVYYVTTFTPIADDPCALGGTGKLWGMDYKTGNAVSELAFSGDSGRSDTLGGGPPSKPVIVMTDEGAKLLASVGATQDDGGGEDGSSSTGAGVVSKDPVVSKNFFELWWKELAQ